MCVEGDMSFRKISVPLGLLLLVVCLFFAHQRQGRGRRHNEDFLATAACMDVPVLGGLWLGAGLPRTPYLALGIGSDGSLQHPAGRIVGSLEEAVRYSPDMSSPDFRICLFISPDTEWGLVRRYFAECHAHDWTVGFAVLGRSIPDRLAYLAPWALMRSDQPSPATGKTVRVLVQKDGFYIDGHEYDERRFIAYLVAALDSGGIAVELEVVEDSCPFDRVAIAIMRCSQNGAGSCLVVD
jgi:hypothetical protein